MQVSHCDLYIGNHPRSYYPLSYEEVDFLGNQQRQEQTTMIFKRKTTQIKIKDGDKIQDHPTNRKHT